MILQHALYYGSTYWKLLHHAFKDLTVFPDTADTLGRYIYSFGEIHSPFLSNPAGPSYISCSKARALTCCCKTEDQLRPVVEMRIPMTYMPISQSRYLICPEKSHSGLELCVQDYKNITSIKCALHMTRAHSYFPMSSQPPSPHPQPNPIMELVQYQRL